MRFRDLNPGLACLGMVAVLSACTAVPETEQDADPESDESASDYVQQRYGLTAAQAELRLDAEDVLGTLSEELDIREQGNFAGSWIDEDAKGTVHFSFVELPPGVEATLRGHFAVGYPVVVEQAKYSTEQLLIWLDAVESLPDLHTAALDESHHRIELTVEPGTAASSLSSAVVTGIPSDALVVTEDASEAQDVSCTSRENCGSPLRAGIKTWDSEFLATTCTLGFTAKSGADRYILTAAHCGEPHFQFFIQPKPKGGGVSVGTVKVRQQKGELDMLAIKLTPHFADDERALVYHRAGDHEAKVEKVGGTSYPRKGATLCHSGITTFHQCGPVAARFVTSKLKDHPTLTHMLKVSMCALPGDSGGPVYRERPTAGGLVALGLVSRAWWEVKDGKPTCYSGSYTLSTYVSVFAHKYGIKVEHY